MRLESESEAFGFFDRWREDGAELRVNAKLGLVFFDVEATVERIDSPLVGLRIEGRGFIEFVLSGKWRFDFVAADAERIKREDTIGKSSSGELDYEFNEHLAAINLDDLEQKIMFMEIVKRSK